MAEASAGWKRALISAGFKKRSGEIYTRPVAEDVIGWLGINKAVHREDGLIEANPVVGVRHQTLERAVAELLDEPFHPYIPPTVSLHLGYVMPGNRYRPWLFGGEQSIEDVVSEMVEAIMTYGVSFMQKNSSLGAIIDEMRAGRSGIPEQLAYRLPVSYLLLGESERARASISASIQRIGDRGDAAAERFRQFAATFENAS